MGLRSRTLACAATRARQTQTTTSCLQHLSGLYRSHGRVVGDPEVMRRNLSLCMIRHNRPISAHFHSGEFSYFGEDLGKPVCEPVETGAFIAWEGAAEQLQGMLGSDQGVNEAGEAWAEL